MLVFRVLQAVPGGIIPVVCMTLIFRIVPPDRIGAAIGLFGVGVAVAPALGPTLGGYLVQYLDWRLIFYLNVPIGLIGLVLAAAMLPRSPEHRLGHSTSPASGVLLADRSPCCWR